MSIWYLTDMPRLAKELGAIKHLEENFTWLKGIKWEIIETKLAIRANIKTHGHIYDIRLIYPTFFPSTPPFVKPVNIDERWSKHQYLNGILCLEWGPDNWYPDITGAQMLESVFKLLEAENPLGDPLIKEMEPVQSRHFLTLGQSVRGKTLRFHITKPITDFLITLEEKSIGEVAVIYVNSKNEIVYHIEKINQFVNEKLPTPFKNGNCKENWMIYRTNTPPKIISSLGMRKITDLFDAIKKYDDYEFKIIENDNGEAVTGIILVDSQAAPHFFRFLKDYLCEIAIIVDDTVNIRTPESYSELQEKRFAIIGLGSVGSKVAESLCRMGANKFYLVDEDLFLLGNLERHSLDWRDIGLHKVEAISQRLKYISTLAEIHTSEIHLNGQESNAALNGVMVRISQCDVIIDATANAQVFNLLSSIAVAKEKPMIWTEVYAGGIGGLIARSRPVFDPEPHIMRQAYLEFANSVIPFDSSENEPYSHTNNEGQVFIASDADISVIASHMTRFVIDTILTPDQSIFPYSMYVIGLSNGWIFSQPFDTKPIQTDHLLNKADSKIVFDEAARADIHHFFKKLLEKTDD